MTVLSENIQFHWAVINPLLTINTEEDYDLAVERLNSMLDTIGTDEQHPLYGLLDTLGTLVQVYEEKHYPMPPCSSESMLHFFMEEHGLTPSELPEIGSDAIVLDVLHGTCELNVHQIRALAQRFHVSPAVFI